MPKVLLLLSTVRRHCLANFINTFSNDIVQKYSYYIANNYICKVHIQSEKCNVCNRLGQRYNVKVTELEFKQLIAEKEKLRKEI
jgi:hypothetical protein